MASAAVARTALDAAVAKLSVIRAGYVPVGNDASYGILLECLVEALRPNKASRPQTPLVNAGYAVRMALVGHIVTNFLEECIRGDEEHVNMVILGAGFDVLGIWASQLSCINSGNLTLRVFELDCPENCAAKRKALSDTKILESSSVDDGASPGTIESGQPPRYCLVGVDLQDIASVEEALSGLIDASRRTLVVSELVLTYLEDSGSTALLQWCASHLCQSPGSSFIAYEPIGRTSEQPSRRVLSTVEGFRDDYCRKFTSKLERGSNNADNSHFFCPLAANCREARHRFEACGFPRAESCLAGIAAAKTVRDLLIDCPETFDEHAALAFHLQCYSLTFGFAAGTMRSLVKKWCGCDNDELKSSKDDVEISVIERKDEERVRLLFVETYESLFAEYPSVRKMVKTALKTDLSSTVDGATVKTDPDSIIGQQYAAGGGGFFVAHFTSAGSSETHVRIVAGCVGVRPYRYDAPSANSIPTFEVHRLAVDARFRNRGVGKSLLSAVEDFVNQTIGAPAQIIATTPAVLEAANHLYIYLGYKMEKEVTMGNMELRTYAKSVQ